MADFTVEFISGSKDEAKPDRDEALRYMGYRDFRPDEDSERLIDECEKELAAVVRPACCFAYTDIEILSDSEIYLGFGKVVSRELAAHLKGCTGAFLFAATIGIGADRLIAKYSRIKPAKSVITDALGSAAIESWCDTVENKLTESFADHRWRFSPGYGDLALDYQRDFMSCLDMNRKLGITLSDSLLMTPTKSVTAIAGVCAEVDVEENAAVKRISACRNKCAECGNVGCAYRKM